MSAAQNWSRENLAWAGGLFEGEGCITTRNGGITLKIAMTDRDVLERFLSIVGMGKISGPRIFKTAHYKPQWIWYVCGAHHSQALLAALWCFLGERRKTKAAEAISYLATRRVSPRYRKTCLKGHPYSEENTRIDSRGLRFCRECGRQATERLRKRKKQNVDLDLRGTQDGCSQPAAAL